MSVHEVKQDKESCPVEQEQNDRSLDSVNIKYHNFCNVKLVIFTNEFSDVLSGMGCFENTFNLQMMDDSWKYQASSGG